MKQTLFLLLSLSIFFAARGQGNNYKQNYTKFANLAPTPPMGWNSWNKFA